MATEITESEVVIYEDIRITAMSDGLKIQTDKGTILVCPKSDNTIVIKSSI